MKQLNEFINESNENILSFTKAKYFVVYISKNESKGFTFENIVAVENYLIDELKISENNVDMITEALDNNNSASYRFSEEKYILIGVK